MLHQKLWQENQDLAQACLNHPFVQGLAQATLERKAFKRYIAQDAFFLKAFMRAYSLCAAKSRNVEQTQVFQNLMGGVLHELQMHKFYSLELGIDLQAVDPYPETSAYTDFLLRCAWHNPLEEAIAAMTPCMRLYAWLGEQTKPFNDFNHPFSNWITTYSSQEFHSLAEDLENLLNSQAKESPPVRDAYRYAMLCERDFFSAPLRESAK